VDPDPLDLVAILTPAPFATGDGDGAASVERALSSPIGSPSLAQLAAGARSAAILVSGKDRITRADVFMPPLLRVLREVGIAPDRTTVSMATGTHVRFRDEDRPVVLGPGFDPRIRVVGHDCTDRANQVELGTTSRGNRIVVNREVYEHDVKVLTGRITHHYFAGFTAGRKSVLPGVSALETIRFNHRLVLSGSSEHPRHPEVRNGSLDGNPVHLDMLEAAAMFQPTFVLNTVIGTDHEVGHVVGGDVRAAHEVGCGLVADAFEVHLGRRADLAIGSCGGAPYDCSFMQSLKTLMNTADCVTDGGVFLLLAECPEGIKPEFLRWEHGSSLPDFARQVVADYDLTGHNTFLLREIFARIRVILVSACPSEQVERIGMIAAATYEEGLARALELLETRTPSTYVIPHGNVTVVEAA
jgi:nickel-dependent lactate racemase